MKTIKVILAFILALNVFATQAQALKIENKNASNEKVNTNNIRLWITDAPSQSGLHFGIKYQPTIGSFGLKPLNDSTVTGKAQIGHGYGASLNFYLGNHVGLHVEGVYSQLSQQFKEPTFDRTIKVSYINIPVLLSLNTNYGKPVSFNVHFGPQLGINTGAKIESTNNGTAPAPEAVLRVRPGDIGLAYGAGVDFGIGPQRGFHINVGFRGVEGLVDISNSSSNLTNNQYYILQKSKISTYGGYVGLMFKL